MAGNPFTVRFRADFGVNRASPSADTACDSPRQHFAGGGTGHRGRRM